MVVPFILAFIANILWAIEPSINSAIHLTGSLAMIGAGFMMTRALLAMRS